MKYWFDTEFIERGPDYPIQLLSIGIVAEDGRELYLESSWANRDSASAWVKEHVFPQLRGCPSGVLPEHHHVRSVCFLGHLTHHEPSCVIRTREDMAEDIRAFCSPDIYGKPEFWAYFADYDWVVFCQIFGTMMDLPKGWPMYCRDIKQEADRIEAWMWWFNNIPDYKLRLPEQGKGEHHALADARWNREAFRFLETLTRL